MPFRLARVTVLPDASTARKSGAGAPTAISADAAADFAGADAAADFFGADFATEAGAFFALDFGADFGADWEAAFFAAFLTGFVVTFVVTFFEVFFEVCEVCEVCAADFVFAVGMVRAVRVRPPPDAARDEIDDAGRAFGHPPAAHDPRRSISMCGIPSSS